jgi:hypothetical protein
MQTDFTTQLLIKHLYNETTEQEQQVVQEALEQNYSLREEFLQLQEMYRELGGLVEEMPSRRSVRVILEYAHEQMEAV